MLPGIRLLGTAFWRGLSNYQASTALLCADALGALHCAKCRPLLGALPLSLIHPAHSPVPRLAVPLVRRMLRPPAFPTLSAAAPRSLYLDRKSPRSDADSASAFGDPALRPTRCPLVPPANHGSSTRLRFWHLRLPFRLLPCLTWPTTCGNSAGLNDPTRLCPDCPHPFALSEAEPRVSRFELVGGGGLHHRLEARLRVHRGPTALAALMGCAAYGHPLDPDHTDTRTNSRQLG